MKHVKSKKMASIYGTKVSSISAKRKEAWIWFACQVLFLAIFFENSWRTFNASSCISSHKKLLEYHASSWHGHASHLGLLANVKPLNLTIQAIPIETKSRKKKILKCTKLEYYKEILNFTNIEYYTVSEDTYSFWVLSQNNPSLCDTIYCSLEFGAWRFRRDSSSLSCDLEVFHKGDHEEFVKQAKNKIWKFGDLFHQRYMSIWPLVK